MFPGGKGGRWVGLTILPTSSRLSLNLGASTSWNPRGLSRPVVELLYVYLPTAGRPQFEFKPSNALLCFTLSPYEGNAAPMSLYHNKHSELKSNKGTAIAGPNLYIRALQVVGFPSDHQDFIIRIERNFYKMQEFYGYLECICCFSSIADHVRRCTF